jgi:hypothetical protein
MVVSPGEGGAAGVGVRRLTEAPTGKRLIAAAYDESAAALAVAADRLVYRYLARPLVDAMARSPPRCAFGIDHFPNPHAAVSELARVASLVGVATWSRPEPPCPNASSTGTQR